MRKQQKRYYKKTFRNLLEQCLWNAYVLFVQHSDRQRSVEHADFFLDGGRPYTGGTSDPGSSQNARTTNGERRKPWTFDRSSLRRLHTANDKEGGTNKEVGYLLLSEKA